MGAVDTSYTFTANDTITSAKMNNIIDQTVITGTAISGTTLQVTPSGQLAVNSQGITSNELAVSSVIQAKLASGVATTGPAFSVVLLSNQSIATGTVTAALTGVEYDTASCFNIANYRFTPNIAGYYQINATLTMLGGGTSTLGSAQAYITKNTSTNYMFLEQENENRVNGSGSQLIYMNGSTDYLRLVAFTSAGTSPVIRGSSTSTQLTRMSGFLARSA